GYDLRLIYLETEQSIVLLAIYVGKRQKEAYQTERAGGFDDEIAYKASTRGMVQCVRKDC
ncbi:MAG TPA: hypothetical protein VG122_19770, partial [Gemmata sp.]|nr:hypothetical protein [Gemmata sp.]